MRKDAAAARVQAAAILKEAATKAAKLELYAKALDEAADAQEDLRTRNAYVTVHPMDATLSVTPTRRNGPRPSAGPMTDLAKALGLDSLQALANELGETYVNVRVINKRGRVPAHISKKGEALKKAHAERSAKK